MLKLTTPTRHKALYLQAKKVIKKETKLILKVLTDGGVPFTKEIHTLDEIKSCGNFIVVCKNVKSYDSLYDYHGIALSPTLFKNSGLSSKINDQTDALDIIFSSVVELDKTMLSTIDKVGVAEV